MRINAHVASGSRQALVFAVRNVFVRVGVDIFLRQTEVNNVHDVSALVCLSTDKKVLWLHVAVYQVLRMDVLHTCYLQLFIQKNLNLLSLKSTRLN